MTDEQVHTVMYLIQLGHGFEDTGNHAYAMKAYVESLDKGLCPPPWSLIVPKVKQTGGIQGPPMTGHVSKRSNHILKDFVVQSAFHIGRCGPKDLQDDFSRREASGQHAKFGIARRFIRMAMCMMRTSQVYLSPEMRSTQIKPERRADYYQAMWPYLRDKWSNANAFKVAFAKDKPLGQCRYIVQEVYGIKLRM